MISFRLFSVPLPFCFVLMLPFGALALAEDPALPRPVLSSELFEAVRDGCVDRVAHLLEADPSQINARDDQGFTPLIHAAMYADEPLVRLLLEKGADPNAKNDDGVTALMQVTNSVPKSRALLEAGAEVNAQSDIGNTPLIRAAVYADGTPLVQLLLEHHADVNLCNSFGDSPLIAAAISGNLDTLRLLLDHGAKTDVDLPLNPVDRKGQPLHPVFSGGQSALMWSALLGREEAARLLLDRGAEVNATHLFGSALTISAWRGNTEVARLLLDRGAKVDMPDPYYSHFTPLLWACVTDDTDLSYYQLLLDRGAEVNKTGGDLMDTFMEFPQIPLLWMKRHGREDVISLLRSRGAEDKEDPWALRHPEPPARALPEGRIPSSAIAQAVRAAVPPLEKSAVVSAENFVANGQRCASCHNQYLPLISLSAVKKKGFPRDEAVARQIREDIFNRPFVQLGREICEPVFHPAPATEFGYALMGLAKEGMPPSRHTDACVNFVAAIQASDGHWNNYLPRPPIQSSDVGSTAWGLQALKLYPLPGRRQEFQERIEKAARWLKAVQPRFTDERVMQLLGLSWAGEPPESLQPQAAALLAEQRGDGGWAQHPGLASDTYATGSALYALHEAAGVSPEDSAYQRGIRFLLKQQLADGTWFVRRRAFPFQPTMHSGFPHGRDGWISAAATSWAVLALTAAVDPRDAVNGENPPPVAHTPDDADRLPPPAQRRVDFASDIQPILSGSCIGCHGPNTPRSKFQVDTYDNLFKPGRQGHQNVIPGDCANSLLVRYAAGLEEDMEMPPPAVRAGIPALTPEQIGLLRAWIDQGANGPPAE